MAEDDDTAQPRRNPGLPGIDDRSIEHHVKLQHRVLGRQLRPLTARRLMLLHAYGVADILTDEDCPRWILQVAALVLSIDDEARLDRRMSPRHPITALWMLATSRIRTARARTRMQAYVVDSLRMPPLFRAAPGTGGAPLTAPWLESRCAKYVHFTSCHPDYPWHLPLDTLAWELATYEEMAGGKDRFVTEDDRAMIESLADQPAPDPEVVEQFKREQAELLAGAIVR